MTSIRTHLRTAIIAMVLAHGWPPLAGTAADPVPGSQVESQLETSDGGTLEYLVYLPSGYAERDHWPLILFLHGRGESNGPLSLVAKWGPPRLAARGDELPFVIVSPQCPRQDRWSSATQQQRLLELLEMVNQSLQVDTDRVYLTGLSMGGFGCWRLAADHPDRFAAVVPICGGGDPQDATALKTLPIWVFHGSEDRAVPLSKSQQMVDAIQAAGGTSIRFTVLEHVGHNSWSAAYATPELYDWMRAQQRQRD